MENATDRAESGSEMLHAFDVAVAALSQAGAHRIESVTIARGWVCMQPADLSDGERIARELALDMPLDHRMTEPGYTVWSGDRDRLEVQVRAALRQRDRALL